MRDERSFAIIEEALTQRSTTQKLRHTKIVLVFCVVVFLLTMQQLGVFEQFAEPERVRQTLVSLGPWGYVSFVVAYAALQPFGVPGTVFVFAAPLIWPWPIAFSLSLVGTMAASVVGFSFSRFVARDWVAARIPTRFRKYEEALERRAFTTVFFLRFVFWMPPLLHAFFGTSNVRFWTHFWGSLAGYTFPLLLVSLFGERLFELVRHSSPTTWFTVVATFAIALFVAWGVRRRCSTTSRA